LEEPEPHPKPRQRQHHQNQTGPDRAMAKSGSFQPARLDVDSSIRDNKLMIVDEGEDPLQAMLGMGPTPQPRPGLDSLLPEAEHPSTTVKPRPGICVKTRTQTGGKFFINLCKLAEIPAPPPIEERELAQMIEAEDYTNLWRVPMSLGQPRKEKDKSGQDCSVAEVAINSSWFDKMLASEIFTSFVITVAMEGLGDKYEEEARLDRDGWTVLKNKKFHGDSCPAHRIQQRRTVGIETVQSGSPARKIEEVTGAGQQQQQQQVEPRYRLVRRADSLVCNVWLPGVRSATELSSSAGEDRLVVSCLRLSYHLDIFLPLSLDSDRASATFHKTDQKLILTIPFI